jgi:hypothetical protein
MKLSRLGQGSTPLISRMACLDETDFALTRPCTAAQTLPKGNILYNVNQQAIGIFGNKMALAPFLRFKVKHNRQAPFFQAVIFLIDVRNFQIQQQPSGRLSTFFGQTGMLII